MNTRTNKFLIGLVLILIVANIASVALFWIKESKPTAMQQPKSPAAFLIKELQLNALQQQQFEALKKEHQAAASTLRKEVKDGKEELFDLLKLSTVADTMKQNAVRKISLLTEELDLVTFNHFEKVRAICNPTQQKKFDEIIKEVTKMMGQQGPIEPGHRRTPRQKQEFDKALPPERPDL